MTTVTAGTPADWRAWLAGNCHTATEVWLVVHHQDSGTPSVRHHEAIEHALCFGHVERKSMAIHSQLISCTASEVAAMVEGAVRHDTTMQVEANYTDSHGQSEIGFGITRLLGFDLLPRIKRINHVKLYRPDAGQALAWPGLAPAMMGRAIRWDLIAQQYDQMIKYATAIRTGTASTEAILRRFTRAASHPTYQAMLRVGRAVKTALWPGTCATGTCNARSTTA